MSSSDDSAAAADGRNHITAIYPDIFQSHILNRLDGAALASISCASSELLSLCDDDHLWHEICNSVWPSTAHCRVRTAISAFPSAHRSFYSDSFPSLDCDMSLLRSNSLETSELISAVDLYYDEKVIFSKVLETETRSNWFQSFPLILDLLDPEEIFPTPLIFETNPGLKKKLLVEENFKISWILIDPARKRAVNVASSQPVEIRWNWINDDVQIRYAMVASIDRGKSVQFTVVVTCGGKEGGKLHVKEVNMRVEDLEGKILNGKFSLGIIGAAMEGQRRRSDGEKEKAVYDVFLRRKALERQKRQRRETGLDLICVVIGLSIFFAIWIYFLR